MALVTLLVFAVVLAGLLYMVSRGNQVVVCGIGIALSLVGALLPWRLGDGGMASVSYLSAKAAEGKKSSFALIFDAAGENHLSYLPVLALLVTIAAAVMLLFAFMASRGRRDPESAGGPVVMCVLTGLCAALLVPLSVMSYRELRTMTPTLDSPIGFACYLVYILGVLMLFFGSILTVRRLPSMTAGPWPHREF